MHNHAGDGPFPPRPDRRRCSPATLHRQVCGEVLFPGIDELIRANRIVVYRSPRNGDWSSEAWMMYVAVVASARISTSATSTQGLDFRLLECHLLPRRPHHREGRVVELGTDAGRISVEHGAFNRCE